MAPAVSPCRSTQRGAILADHRPPLDAAVEALVGPQLRANECIDGWTVMPTDDLVVFIIDCDLQQELAPFIEKGRPRLGCGRTLVFARQSGSWQQVGLGSWGVGVDKLLLMFQAANKQEPA